MLLAFFLHHEFQNVPNGCKYCVLNIFIQEKVYVDQPSSFKYFSFSTRVFKPLVLGLIVYQSFYLKIIFKEKRLKLNITLLKIYVDDIICDSTEECLCKYFSNMTQNEFKISIIGELQYFLALHIH